MALTQLIYTSRRTPQLTIDALRAIAHDSAQRNRARNITGLLLNCGEHLMQVLEGDARPVDALFERIRTDPRHTDVTCLVRKNIDRRLFPEWGMTLYEPLAGHRLSVDRLATLIDCVREYVDTAGHSSEARILLADFRRQIGHAAA